MLDFTTSINTHCIVYQVKYLKKGLTNTTIILYNIPLGIILCKHSIIYHQGENHMAEIVITEKSTGNVLSSDDWEASVIDPTLPNPDDLLINLNKKGTRFDSSNLHLSVPSDDEESVDSKETTPHPDFGNYINLFNKRRRFTKVFHNIIPIFSNPTFKAFWFDITIRLTQDTNIIYTIKNKQIRFANSRQDLMEICNAKQSKFYAFLRECLANSLIAEFRTDTVLFIVNPYYALNGNRIPEVLYDLFNKPIEYYQREYDKDLSECSQHEPKAIS